MTYEEHHAALVAYLMAKVSIKDWHGVRDAAVDIEILEAQKRTKTWVEQQAPDPQDVGLVQALQRMARQEICPKCGQKPYDGHDMCSGSWSGVQSHGHAQEV
jgi:hypothetical protein